MVGEGGSEISESDELPEWRSGSESSSDPSDSEDACELQGRLTVFNLDRECK